MATPQKAGFRESSAAESAAATLKEEVIARNGDAVREASAADQPRPH